MLNFLLLNKGNTEMELGKLLCNYNFESFYDELQTWLVTGI